MQPSYYYDRSTACWWGFWEDSEGYQIGEAIHEYTKESLLIELGKIHQSRADMIAQK